MRYFEVQKSYDFGGHWKSSLEGSGLLKIGKFPVIINELTYDFNISYYRSKQEYFHVYLTFDSTFIIKSILNNTTLNLLEKY